MHHHGEKREKKRVLPQYAIYAFCRIIVLFCLLRYSPRFAPKSQITYYCVLVLFCIFAKEIQYRAITRIIHHKMAEMRKLGQESRDISLNPFCFGRVLYEQLHSGHYVLSRTMERSKLDSTRIIEQAVATDFKRFLHENTVHITYI